MALKLDFEKAYDRVNMHFIFQILKCLSFDDTFLHWIKLCVNTVSFQVLINGSPSAPFEAGNGVIQGEPLSPFSFIICLEALSRLINYGVKEKYLDGISISRGAPKITLSLYAYDCIVLLKASYKNACNLRHILDSFCRWSGQLISDAKSTLLTSMNLGRSFSK